MICTNCGWDTYNGKLCQWCTPKVEKIEMKHTKYKPEMFSIDKYRQ